MAIRLFMRSTMFAKLRRWAGVYSQKPKPLVLATGRDDSTYLQGLVISIAGDGLG